MSLPLGPMRRAPIRHGICDDGAYFTAINPTPGTGFATIAAANAFADVSPFLYVLAGLKSVYFDFLSLIATVPGTGSTALRALVQIMDGKAVPTGGTEVFPNNTNNNNPAASACRVFMGPLAAAASVNPRQIWHDQVRPVIPVVNDQYLIQFGGDEGAVSSLLSSGAANADRYLYFPAVEIAPGKCAQIHVWSPGQTVAAQYESRLALYEY